MFEAFLIYGVSYKTTCGKKCDIFNKVDEFIRYFDWTKYLILIGSSIFNRIRYLIRIKDGISYPASQKYSKIKIDLDDELP